MNRLHIIVSLILALSFIVSCASGSPEDSGTVGEQVTTVLTGEDSVSTSPSVVTEPSDPEKDSETAQEPARDDNGIYLISTAADMVWLSDHVNEHNAEVGEDFKARLENDIDMSEVGSWIPIGSKNANMFRGEFDGNGKTVSGLTLVSDEDYVALFGVMYGGTIKDLTLTDSSFTGSKYIAGICASNTGSVIGCNSSAGVIGGGTAGGICAINYGSVVNCENTGDIKAEASIAGGICGFSHNSSVIGCKNSGDVTCVQYAGGICGYDEYGLIENCENNGSVTASAYAGGIAGRSLTESSYTLFGSSLILSGEDKGRIYSCINSGDVGAADQYAGGICGYSCYLIENCVNEGRIGAENARNCGGICGYADRGAILACVNTGTVSCMDGCAGIAAYSGAPIVICLSAGEVGATGSDGRAAGICEEAANIVRSCINDSYITGYTVSGICGSSNSNVMYCASIFRSDCAAVECAMTVNDRREGCSVIGCYACTVNYVRTADSGYYMTVSIGSVTDGELAFAMNTYPVSEIYKWGQIIGSDLRPTVTSDDSLTVYKVRRFSTCDIQNGDYTFAYRNVDEDFVPEHHFEEGVCTVCGMTAEG